MLHYRNGFQLTVRVYHVINLFFSVISKKKAIFNFHSTSKAQYLCFSFLWLVFCCRLQTIRETCVLLIFDTFGVFWFLSLEYTILYYFSFGFQDSSRLKRVQLHLQRNAYLNFMFQREVHCILDNLFYILRKYQGAWKRNIRSICCTRHFFTIN